MKTIVLSTLCFIALISCTKQEEPWSAPIRAAVDLAVSGTNEQLKYTKLNGTYQAMYQTPVCWPAEQFINSTADRIAKQGWNRLSENSFNPGSRNSWSRNGSIFEQWGRYLENNSEIHQWTEEWVDNNQNLLQYIMKYETERKGNIIISSKDCNLRVYVIYIPKELRPTQEEIQERHKTEK